MTEPSNTNHSNHRWLLELGSLLALCAGVTLAPSARAQCVPINAVAPPTGDAALFAIEGKITAFDRTAAP